MPGQHLVVIGNGPAGNQAALTLREKAPDARITIISKHFGGSCHPHLIPEFITGKISEESLFAVTPHTYTEKNIKFRQGQRVVDLNPVEKTLTLDHKEVIAFDGVIIAVGGKPRIPEYLKAVEDSMLTLKTIEDAEVWISRLAESDSVLLIGGDLTSLAVTNALLSLGKKIYFMLSDQAFWPLRPDEALFREVSERLTCKGVEVISGKRLKGLTRSSGHSVAARCDNGDELEVDMVGAFFGLAPDIGFLRRSGIRMDRGLLVDEYLRTSFEGVYATGDCAQIYHPELRDYWVSIGHDNAVVLGRTAANNLLGGKKQTAVVAESIFEVEGINVNTSWWMEF